MLQSRDREGSSDVSGAKSAVRKVLESLFESEVTGPLHELSDVLVGVSGRLGKLQRTMGNGGLHAAELAALDSAFSRSIVLTRTVHESLKARRPRGEFASATNAAREVVGLFQTSLPDSVSLSLHCPPGPAVVAADRDDLRRAIGGLLAAAIVACSETMARTSIEVLEVGQRNRVHSVRIDVRCESRLEDHNACVEAVRPIVDALGGKLEQHFTHRGTVVSLTLLRGY
jgi:hypothetical protein